MAASSSTPRLTIRDFLQEVREQAIARIDPDLGPPSAKRVFSSLQIHFGEPRLHYEVWPVNKTGRIEVGLHIEGPHDWSREVAARLACRADDLRAALGAEWELEDWTASWSRLHTTLPLPTLTLALAGDVAAATAALINGAEPVLRRIELPAPPAAGPRSEGRERRHWRRHRRS